MSAIDNGSRTHVRYCRAHFSPPSLISLRCPRCGHEAHATRANEARFSDGDAQGNVYQLEREWHIACTYCPLRTGPFGYRGVRAYAPLYFSLVDESLWAWNRLHLEMLVLVLEKRDITEHPYAWFATYVRGEWKRRSRRTLAIARRLYRLP